MTARLGSAPAAKKQIDNRYLRENEAAAFLGASVSTLQGWRSRVTAGGLSVTKAGGMVMYSSTGVGAIHEKTNCCEEMNNMVVESVFVFTHQFLHQPSRIETRQAR